MTVVSSGQLQIVSSGQTDRNDTILAGGMEIVLSGGMASGIVVDSGGWLQEMGAASATSVTVNSGGVMLISGGSVTNLIVNSGGNAAALAAAVNGIVQSGGKLIALPGASINISGSVQTSGVFEYNSGTDLLSYTSNPANGWAVSSGGGIDVLSGGTASSTTILSGGTETILAGGVDENATISSGGIEILSVATYVTNPASTGYATLVPGGVASDTSIAAGGLVLVSSGAVISGGNVASGGYLAVLSGGATAGTISGSGVVLPNAAAVTISDPYFMYGPVTVSDEFVHLFDTITTGGTEIVSSGGFTGNATILAGGAAVLSGGATAVNILVDSGAVLLVSSGATLSNGTAVAGGYIIKLPGAVSISTPGATETGVFELNRNDSLLSHSDTLLTGNVINSGYTGYVLNGGTESTAAIDLGGTETIFSGGEALNTSDYGRQLVSTGGITSATTIYDSGTETILSGGTALNETVLTGGLLDISSGGYGAGSVSTGGVVLVESGANVTMNLSSGAYAVLLSGYSGSITGGTTISGGIVEFGNGSASALDNGANITLASGEQAFVQSGTSAATAIVSPGATLDVLPGGTIGAVTLDFGATLSMSSSASIGSVTIEVGSGSYTNDSAFDIASTLNSELASVPEGTSITIIFNPGTYSETGPILLPSDTSIIGDDATLGAKSGSDFNGTALIANADAYAIGNAFYIYGTLGNLSYRPHISDDETFVPFSTIAIDSNISVEGMIFNVSGDILDSGGTFINSVDSPNGFGTWFINAENVDVTNNVYIGGGDGNAFVNVTNAVVAGNIAVGDNTSYDNWSGANNVSIEDNSAFQGTANSSPNQSAIQLNSTQNSSVSNSGATMNDGLIDNQFASDYANSQAIAVMPLQGFSATLVPSSKVDMQGNIDSLLDLASGVSANQYYVENTQGAEIEDNLISGVMNVSSSVLTDISARGFTTSGAEIIGNLDFGEYFSASNIPVVNNTAAVSLTQDNALLGENASQSTVTAFGTGTPNIASFGTMITGSLVAPDLDIIAPPEHFISGNATIDLSGTLEAFIADRQASDTIFVTLTTEFGHLTETGITPITLNGETALVLSGAPATVNQELANLTYAADGTLSDSIELTVSAPSNTLGSTFSSRYIPVLIEPSAVPGTIITIGTSFMTGTLALDGDVLIAAQGNNTINMGSTASLAFLGTGSNTVIGGTGEEYVNAGSGPSVVSLSSAGTITVVGGAGSLNVIGTAAGTADLIETGAANSSVSGGAAPISVVGGLGTLNYTGGSGSTYLATLPEDGGKLTAQLGSGSSTVFALSGAASISTAANTHNFLVFGLGGETVSSNGAAIPLGNTLVSYGDDTVYAGLGALTFAGGNSSGSDFIMGDTAAGAEGLQATLGSGNTAVIAGAGGNTVFGGAGAFSFQGMNAAGNELIEGGSGTAIVTLGGAAATIRGGSGGDCVYGGTGNLVFAGSAASTGRNYIDAGAGATQVTLGGAAGTVIGGTGSNTVTGNATQAMNITLGKTGSLNLGTTSGAMVVSVPSGTQDTIVAGTVSGADTVNLQTSLYSNLITMNGGNVYFATSSATGGSVTLDVTAGNATVDLASHWLSFDVKFGSSANSKLVFLGGSNGQNNTVSSGDAGSVTVSGGTGNGYFVGGAAGNNSLIGGNGLVTLVGGGNGDILLAAANSSGSNDLTAGAGTETLLGTTASGANIFGITAGAVNDVVSTGGSGGQSYFLQSTSSGSTTTITGAMAASSNIFYLNADTTALGNYVLRGLFGSSSNANWDLWLENSSNNGAGEESVSSANISYGAGYGLVRLSDGVTIKVMGAAASGADTIGIGSAFGLQYLY